MARPIAVRRAPSAMAAPSSTDEGPMARTRSTATPKPAAAPIAAARSDSSRALAPMAPGPTPRTASIVTSSRRRSTQYAPAAPTSSSAVMIAAMPTGWIALRTFAERVVVRSTTNGSVERATSRGWCGSSLATSRASTRSGSSS